MKHHSVDSPHVLGCCSNQRLGDLYCQAQWSSLQKVLSFLLFRSMAKWWKALQCHKPNSLPVSVHEKGLLMMQLGLWEAFLKAAFMPSSIISSTSQEQCGFLKEWIHSCSSFYLWRGCEGLERTKEGPELRTLGHTASLLLHTNKQSMRLVVWWRVRRHWKAGVWRWKKIIPFLSMQIHCWWCMVLVGHGNITIRDHKMCLMSF